MTRRLATVSQSKSQQLAEILESVLKGLEEGEAVDLGKLRSQYPELASELEFCVGNLQFLEGASQLLGPDEQAGDNHDDDLPFREIGDFRLLRELGRGGMGVVYEAEQISMLGRYVALKVLPFAGMASPASLQRFHNEVRAAGSLDHPNIVSVYSAGEVRGIHYYAMQLIRGQSMATLIDELAKLRHENALDAQSFPGIVASVSKRSSSSGTALTEVFSAEKQISQPAPRSISSDNTIVEVQGLKTTRSAREAAEYFRSVAELGIQAAEALHHAHERGVIHRDIKPANLMMDAASQIHITDFGLAQIEENTGVTMTGDLVGTLRYMSPEQVLGKRVAIDHRTDIYSLGTTIFELITTKPTFDGNTRATLIKQIAFDEPPRLRTMVPDAPRDLETIIHKAISKSPGERYATAKDLADDLKRFLEHRPIHAKPPTLAQRIGKWSLRHKPIVASAAVLLLVGSVGLAISNILIRGERDEKQNALNQLQNALTAAEFNLDLAGEERARAETNLRMALSVVDEICLAPFVNGSFLKLQGNIPSITLIGSARDTLTEQESLLAKQGLKFYETIGEQNQSSQFARIESAKALSRAALLSANLNAVESARRQYREAISQFQQILQDGPDNAELYLEMAQARYYLARLSDWMPDERDEFYEVIRIASRILELEPSNVSALELRSKSFVAVGQVEEAISDLEKALAERPEDPALNYQMSWLHDFGDALTGVKYAELAVKHAEKAQTRAYDLLLYYRALEHQYEIRAEDRELAIATCIRAAEALADWPLFAFEMHSKACRIRDDFDGMLELAQRMIDNGEDSYLPYFAQAEAYANLNKTEESLSSLKLAADRAQSDWESIGVGNIYKQLKRFEDARAAYERALELNPNNYVCYGYSLGNLLMDNGKIDEAILQFEKALALQASYIPAVGGITECLKKQERFDEAIAHLSRAIETSSNGIVRRYAQYRRAVLNYRSRNYSAALEDLRAAFSQSGNSFDLHGGLGINALLNSPDEAFRGGYRELLEDALETYSKRITDSPEDLNNYVELGFLNLDLNNPAVARRDFYRAKKLESENRGVMPIVGDYALALLYLADGDRDSYINTCQSMLDKSGDSGSIQDASWTCWSCALSDDLDSTPFVQLAESHVSESTDLSLRKTFGALLYRAGRFDEALQVLVELANQEIGTSSSAYTWFFLAMTYHANGDFEQAQAWASKAIDQANLELDDLGSVWNRRLTLELLREETQRKLALN